MAVEMAFPWPESDSKFGLWRKSFLPRTLSEKFMVSKPSSVPRKTNNRHSQDPADSSRCSLASPSLVCSVSFWSHSFGQGKDQTLGSLQGLAYWLTQDGWALWGMESIPALWDLHLGAWRTEVAAKHPLRNVHRRLCLEFSTLIRLITKWDFQ